MSSVSTETEQLILSKSKEFFFTQGRIKASTQEIADFVGIQRTSVNYYFRSKLNLLRLTYAEVIKELKIGLKTIYSQNDNDFEQKVSCLIDFMYDFKQKYPYLDVYDIIKTNNMLDDFKYNKITVTEGLNQFLEEIKEQMDSGRIQKSNPVNFLFNIYSLVSYPLLMRGIYKDVFALSDDEFEELLVERKSVIKDLIFNK